MYSISLLIKNPWVHIKIIIVHKNNTTGNLKTIEVGVLNEVLKTNMSMYIPDLSTFT